MPAAAEFDWKKSQTNGGFGNSMEQAPKGEAAVHTRPSSSVSDSNISAVSAITEVPTAKKKSKIPLVFIAIAVLVAASAIFAVINYDIFGIKSKLESNDGLGFGDNSDSHCIECLTPMIAGIRIFRGF